VAGFGGGKLWRRCGRYLMEANGGRVGGRIWWRDLVEGNGGVIRGGIWSREGNKWWCREINGGGGI
jgi:hypothetical protein